MKWFVTKIVEGQMLREKRVGKAFASSNIALCKYWGKRDASLNLPINSSLSVSLGSLGTQTKISVSEKAVDEVWLNGVLQKVDSDFAKRVSNFLDPFRPHVGNVFFTVHTENNIPTAAGLASSASGFAALVLALHDWAGWTLTRRDLSMLARLGSGSASRSIFNGFVQWNAGTREDGMDSFAEPLPVEWNDFRVGVLEISDQEKRVGSRDGMARTVKTSALYKVWPNQAQEDLTTIRTAIETRDFNQLGKTAERNALTMHATMMASSPPLLYFLPETIKQIHHVHQLRKEGLELYLTIDAGPNLKLLFQKKDQQMVKEQFPTLQIIAPFSSVLITSNH